jgi:hypothetical protein
MGAGESTTGQRLWLHLLRHGDDARWFFEDDTKHPLWHPDDRLKIIDAGVVEPSYLTETMTAKIGANRHLISVESGR